MTNLVFADDRKIQLSFCGPFEHKDKFSCMHSVLGSTGSSTAEEIPCCNEVSVSTTDTSRSLWRDLTRSHITDTATGTAQSKTTLWLLLIKTVKRSVHANLFHTKNHFTDCRIRSVLKNILLRRKCFPVGSNSLHIIFCEITIMSMRVCISFSVYMSMCLSADRKKHFRHAIFVKSNDCSMVVWCNLKWIFISSMVTVTMCVFVCMFCCVFHS